MKSIRYQKQLAAKLHRGLRTVERWIKSPSWKQRGLGHRDFDYARVLEWCAAEGIDIDEADPIDSTNDTPAQPSTNGQGTPPKMSLLQKINVQKKIAETKKINLEFDIKADKYVSKTAHNEMIVGMVVTVRNQIEDFVETYPALLNNSTETVVRTLLTEWYDTMCADIMSAGAEVWVNEQEQGEATEKLKDLSKVRAAHKRHRN